jgi:hypothetical protein
MKKTQNKISVLLYSAHHNLSDSIDNNSQDLALSINNVAHLADDVYARYNDPQYIETHKDHLYFYQEPSKQTENYQLIQKVTQK